MLAAIRRAIAREQTGGRAPAGLILAIDEGERRAVVVTNNEGRLVDFFDVPRSREAATAHRLRAYHRGHQQCFSGNSTVPLGRC